MADAKASLLKKIQLEENLEEIQDAKSNSNMKRIEFDERKSLRSGGSTRRPTSVSETQKSLADSLSSISSLSQGTTRKQKKKTEEAEFHLPAITNLPSRASSRESTSSRPSTSASVGIQSAAQRNLFKGPTAIERIATTSWGKR
eukprot:TRINITY_DN29038_c0_g1_i1.p1 TRINITY_DN29038_c0_g1~~TRINITY_DN29038_c0_g1_i1.p1  ORF type:complete len:166 (-),score=54.04 TRINITY_DN29038_c0_g1_i1:129-560(-)